MTSIKGSAAETTGVPDEHGGAADAAADAAVEPGTTGKLTLAEILEIFAGGRLPLRFTAYDGSSAGPWSWSSSLHRLRIEVEES